MEWQTDGLMAWRRACSYLPSNSCNNSNDHAPSLLAPIALKLGMNIKHKWYDVLTANQSASVTNRDSGTSEACDRGKVT